jgi:dCMP deaminase
MRYYTEVDSLVEGSWNQYWLEMAQQVASRSTCPRLSVGAIAVKDNQMKGSGFNGAVKGAPECDDIGCDMDNGSCQRAVHAEQNLIIHTDIDERKNSKVYVTHNPCRTCSKLLVNSQINELHYLDYYKGSKDCPFLRRHGVSVFNYSLVEVK